MRVNPDKASLLGQNPISFNNLFNYFIPLEAQPYDHFESTPDTDQNCLKPDILANFSAPIAAVNNSLET